MPTAWPLHTLAARINQQIVQVGHPGETQSAVTEKLLGSPPDFEIATSRPPVAPDRVEDSGLELAQVRRLDLAAGRHWRRTKCRDSRRAIVMEE
jgi:hypothetical protein